MSEHPLLPPEFYDMRSGSSGNLSSVVKIENPVAHEGHSETDVELRDNACNSISSENGHEAGQNLGCDGTDTFVNVSIS